jgi:hypothetical protein
MRNSVRITAIVHMSGGGRIQKAVRPGADRFARAAGIDAHDRA